MQTGKTTSVNSKLNTIQLGNAFYLTNFKYIQKGYHGLPRNTTDFR